MGIFDQKISCRTRHDESYPKTPFLGTFVMAELVFMAGDCSRRATIFGAPSPPTTAYCLRALDVNNTSPPCQFPTNIIFWRIVIYSIVVTVVVIVVVAASCRCNRRSLAEAVVAAAYRRPHRRIQQPTSKADASRNAYLTSNPTISDY